MKTQSTALYVLRLTVTLLLITGIVAACLAGVNAITAERIAQLTEEKTQRAIEAVLPGGGEPLESFPDDTGLVKAVYASASGYAVQVAPVGFDGEIDMMVGISANGGVTSISIISHTETAGLGAIAAADTAAGEAFRSQFAGMTGSVSVSKEGGQIDALTGATVTSRAICKGVSAAIACVDALELKEGAQ